MQLAAAHLISYPVNEQWRTCLFVRTRWRSFLTSGSQHAMVRHMLVTGARSLSPTNRHFTVKVRVLLFSYCVCSIN